jgi:putative DNA primase/helicase
MTGEDIADYLAAHPDLTLPELLALIAGAPGWTPAALQPNRRPDLVCLATVQPETVSFLWKPYVPLGKLTILEGDPAAGKTYIALDLCARVTRGETDKSTPDTVVYLTGEDDLADTIRPRFDSLKGDATRFFALQGSIDSESGQREGVTLTDIPLLESVLAEHKPSLVVVDPIQAFLGKEVDFHRANEVRPVLDDLRRLAESYNCAVLIIRHLSKATQAKALYRGIGSVDLTAAARSVLLMGADPRNDGNFALFHIKSSTAKRGASLSYRVSHEGIFAWTGESDLSVEELLAPVDIEKWTAVKEAEEFLKNALAHGPCLVTAVKEQADAEEIKEKTLRRAKKNLGVASLQQGGEWLWELPKQAGGQSSASDAHT